MLLLMGPIGLFFARFCRYLQGCGIPVTKVAFPLREFGFPADVCVLSLIHISEPTRP